MEFERVSEREWEEIILKSDDAYFFHSPTWAKILEKTYDYRAATRLYNVNGKSILIPMMEKNIYGLKSFSSMPGSPGYGGFFPDFDVSSDELGRIVGDIVGGRNLSFNLSLPPNVHIPSPGQELGTEIRDEWSYTHVLNLEGRDFEEIWKNYHKKTRNQIRKSVKSGVEVREGTSVDDYRTFYNIWTKASQKWGYENPPQSFEFFRNLYKYGSSHVKLSLATKDDITIAGLVSFHYAKTIYYHSSAFLAEYGISNPTRLLYNDSIVQACQEDCKYVDFGPSGNLKGLRRYKEGFGAEKADLQRYLISSNLSRILSKVNEVLRVHRAHEG